MYLGPHHFQLQSRYFEDSIWFAASSLWYEPWGFSGCSLDEEALRNGTVAVLHARGVFPDGLPFNMPEGDPLPQARAIGDVFPPDRDTLTAFLTVPERRPNGLNVVPAEAANGNSVRFVAEPRPMYDETTGLDEKPVRIGRKNVRIVFET